MINFVPLMLAYILRPVRTASARLRLRLYCTGSLLIRYKSVHFSFAFALYRYSFGAVQVQSCPGQQVQSCIGSLYIV